MSYWYMLCLIIVLCL